MSSKKKKNTKDMGEDEVFKELDRIVSDMHDEVEDSEHIFVSKELPEKPDTLKVDEVSHKKEKKSFKKHINYGEVISGSDRGEITQKLAQIYENGDGTMPDMHKFEKRKRSKILRAFFVLLFSSLFFATVAWLGFFVIAPQSHFKEEDVILTISGDEEISYGAEVTYRIRYRNSQNVALEKANLEIRYPKGFVFVTSSIATSTEHNDAWKLGTLDPQGSGYLDVTGRIYGTIEEKQSFRVFLNYVPANFSSEFQKVAHVTLTITEVPFDITLDMPDKLSTGADTSAVIRISPKDGQKLSYLQVRCESELFSVKSLSGTGADENKNCLWNIDELSQAQELQVSGSFSEDIEVVEKQIFTVIVSAWHSLDKTQEPQVLVQVEKEITLSKADTLFNLVVNGGAGSMSVEPGESLNMTANLKNSGELVMKNIELKVSIEAPSYTNRSMLNWAKLEVTGDADIYGKQLSDEVRQGELVFDKRYISDLGQLMPGEELSVDVSLPIKNGLETTLSNYKSSAIRIYAELKYTGADEVEVLTSNEVNLNIVSDLDIEVTDQISQNVEGNTVHMVTWLLSNSFHDLEKITLVADVYGDVLITKDAIVVPSGEVEYDLTTKKIKWTIEKMPTSIDVLAMQIPIVVKTNNPSQKNLTSKVTVKAHDVVSNDEILKFGEEILLN